MPACGGRRICRSTSDQPKYFSHFSLEQFRAGVRSTVFKNAPVGLIFQGDPGYPGNAASVKHWDSLAPRVAAVWDPRGDGRMTLRTAYGRFYEPPHLVNFFGFVARSAVRQQPVTNNGTFDGPWINTPGGNPFPIVAGPDVTFPRGGRLRHVPLDMKPPYADQWNVSVQRQLGASWMVSANYLSSRGHRLPVGDQINPAVFSPGATTANTNERRVLALRTRRRGVLQHDLRAQADRYLGVRRAVAVRAAPIGQRSVSVRQLHRCRTACRIVVDYVVANGQVDLVKPGDPGYDRGSCGSTDQRHVVNLSTVYQMPGASSGVLRRADERLAGLGDRRWRARGRLQRQHRRRQRAERSSQPASRPGDGRPLREGRLSLAGSGCVPGAGARHLRQSRVNSLVAPNWFNVDMGLVRSFRIGAERQIQFRAEVFNLLNRVHLDCPVALLNNPNFGLFTETAADPRIVQLALKYVF